MSTRCQIGIYNNKEVNNHDFVALLYRHTDGYPDGILPDIKPFLKEFDIERGCEDTEYLAARLLQYLCNKHDLHKKDFIGLGICNDFHEDIEYFYKISPHLIEVYKTTPEDFTLIQTVVY